MSELTEIKTSIEETQNLFKSLKEENEERIKALEAKDGTAIIDDKLKKIDDAIEANEQKMEAAFNRMKAGNQDNELKEATKEYKEAMFKYLKTGDSSDIEKGIEKMGDEFKALSVNSDPNGGYLVEPDKSGRVSTVIFETSPIRQYASVQKITTDRLQGTFDDEDFSDSDVKNVSETGARPTNGNPEFGQWEIPAHEMYTAPKATQKLLDDTGENIWNWLEKKITSKFARKQNKATVVGTGVNEARGFLTYPAAADPYIYERGKIGQVASGSATDITVDGVLDLIDAIKDEYAPNMILAGNRRTFSKLRKLKDSNGAYLWEPSLQAGQPPAFDGVPIAKFNDMPVVAGGALALAVADFSMAYQIVDREGIRVLRDPYTNKPYVIFYSTTRFGGAVINFDAIKLMKIGA